MKIVKLPAPVSTIYKAVEELKRLYGQSGRKFTPDGHLVGSLGEVIAAEALGLELLPNSHPGHDARDQEGRLVQIKMTAGKRIALSGECQRLVVLRIIDPEHAEIIYNDSGALAWKLAGNKQKNGQRPLSLNKLLGHTSN
jgi:hypothetical protein